MNILVSGCLLGIPCRYDGSGQMAEDVRKLMEFHHLIPVCPEQLGGMPTPRLASEIKNGRVVNREGQDVTSCFEAGAGIVKDLAMIYKCRFAILKERSPSCGSGVIYDGSFSGSRIPGDGMTAGCLRESGIVVLGESKAAGFYNMESTGTILETDRLVLRKLTEEDYGNLCGILQDSEVMYAYEHAFSHDEVRQWLNRQTARYEAYGFGLWGVVLKETGEFIGQCGITMQDWEGKEVPEIGYLFSKAFWHKGYASEAAMACRDLAFEFYGFRDVYSIIRDNNAPSKHVAERNGMKPCGSERKHYYGMDMPHTVYKVSAKNHE